MSICDYYLFIDFRREKLGWRRKCRGSLFTHQELAIARHLGFSEIIALQQKGVELEGFAQYILSNPELFEAEGDLLNKIERLVKEHGWNKDYSRNLVAGDIIKNNPVLYKDRKMSSPRNEIVWHCHILNKRNDRAAVNTLAILKQIENANGQIISPDKTFLKWVLHDETYSKTIFPMSNVPFDVIAIDTQAPSNVYLHSLSDSLIITPTSIGRPPIITGPVGRYRLTYQVFAENFPMLEFCVVLDLTGDITTTSLGYE